MSEDNSVNGSGATEDQVAQSQAALQISVDAFARALIQSKSIGEQINFNPIEAIVQVELQKIQMGLLLEALTEAGVVNGIAWRAALASRLDGLSEQLRGPRIALPLGRGIKGN